MLSSKTLIYFLTEERKTRISWMTWECRGDMPIETKGARAPSDFWAKWILNAPSKRQKIGESYFYIWYNHTGVIRSFSASNHQLLNSNLSFAGWRWARDRRVFTALHYNQSHTMLLSLWMQWPIRGVQMSHRWNTVFCSGRAHWILWRILLSETTKCRSAYDVRDSFHNANSFSDYNGSFWDWSLDNEMIMFLDNVA